MKNKSTPNEIKTSDWDLMIFGGLSKNQIRELSKGIFNDNFIFATLKEAKYIENNNLLITIELDNACINKLDNMMGNNYAERLSLNSETHNFKFNCFKSIKKREDLHNYEPTKIFKGTYSNIEYVYIILHAFEETMDKMMLPENMKKFDDKFSKLYDLWIKSPD